MSLDRIMNHEYLLTYALLVFAFSRMRSGLLLPVLTGRLELYDEDANPYNPIVGSWASAS